MGTFPRVNQIRRVGALTLLGNSQATEGRAEDLTASEARIILGLATTNDVTFDIVRATTSVLTPLLNNTNAAALILGNSTYGVTVPGAITSADTGSFGTVGGVSNWMHSSRYPTIGLNTRGVSGTYIAGATGYGAIWQYDIVTGDMVYYNYPSATAGASRTGITAAFTIAQSGAATFSGDISMRKTSAQGHIRAYATDGVKNAAMYHDGTRGTLSTSSGNITLNPAIGITLCFTSGTNSILDVYDSAGSRYIRSTHDSTNGILSTSSGSIIYTPANGLAYQFTSGTDSNFRIYNAAGSKSLTMGIATANDYCSIQSGGTNMKLTLQEADGRPLVVGNTGTAAAKFHVRADATAGSGLPVRIDGVTGNGSNLTEWGLYNSTTLAAITSTGSLTCAGITASGNATLSGSTATVAASTSLLRLTSAATGFEFRPAAGYIEQWTSGSDGQYNIYESTGTKRLKLHYSTSLDSGVITTNTKLMLDIAGTVGVLGFGQSGNGGDPGLKRGGHNILAARSADDTADSAFTCAGITASGSVSFTGGLSTGTVTKSANYTTTADDYCVNVTANSIDITFETAVGCANREHEVINSGSGVVTLKTTSGQTISGNASGALTLAQWKSIRVKSDGANWLIMSQVT